MNTKILAAGLPLRVRARLQGGLAQVEVDSARTLEELRGKLRVSDPVALVLDESIAPEGILPLLADLSRTYKGTLVFIAHGRHSADHLRDMVRLYRVAVILQHPVDPDELVKALVARLDLSCANNEKAIPDHEGMLEEVWDKHHDLVEDRLKALADVSTGPTLEGEDLKKASRAAHQLAGSLGLFGMQRATLLAREAENLTHLAEKGEPFQQERLQKVIGVLREIVASKGSSATARAKQGPRVDSLLLLVSDSAELAESLEIEAVLLHWNITVCHDLAQLPLLLDDPLAHAVLLDLEAQTCKDRPELVEDLLADALPCVVLGAEPSKHSSSQVRWIEPPVPPYELMMAVIKSQATPAPDNPPTVLVVDDDQIVLKVVSNMLQKVDILVETLNNPLEFWDTLERLKPDLVILDVDLPPLGGIELCRAMRADPRYAATPVIFQSSYTDAQTMQRVFQAGGDDYLYKPASGLELLTRVSNRLERTRQVALTPMAAHKLGPVHSSLDHLLLRSLREEIPVCLASLEVESNEADDKPALQRVQRHLRQSLRGDDVVRQMGNNELLIGMLGVNQARARMRLESILQPVIEHPHFGVAEFPEQATDFDHLVELARGQRLVKAAIE